METKKPLLRYQKESIYNGSTFDISKGRRCFSGIDLETNKVQIYWKYQSWRIVKIAGHTVWAGNYSPRKYMPVTYLAFQLGVGGVKVNKAFSAQFGPITTSLGRKGPQQMKLYILNL